MAPINIGGMYKLTSRSGVNQNHLPKQAQKLIIQYFPHKRGDALPELLHQ